MSEQKNQGIKEELRWQNEHRFCKGLLAEKRRNYKCSQNRITALKDSTNAWHIYIDPEGYVGAYGHVCCKWEAMIKALEDKFSLKKESLI